MAGLQLHVLFQARGLQAFIYISSIVQQGRRGGGWGGALSHNSHMTGI